MKTIMCVLMLLTICSTGAEGFVEDEVVPEGAVHKHGASTPEDRLRKLWATPAVRRAAEVSLLETESTARSAATATSQVAYSEAMAAVQQMGNDNACASLARSTIEDVKTNVEGNQKVLDALDTGEHCDALAEAAKTAKDKADADAAAAAAKVKAVQDAQDEVNQATEEVTTAQAEKEKAKMHKVDFDIHHFEHLTTCNKEGTFCWNDKMVAIYQKAKDRVDVAQTKIDNANSKLSDAQSKLDNAQNSAAANAQTQALMVEVRRTEMIATHAKTSLAEALKAAKLKEAIDCECKAKTEYEKEWLIASQGPQVESEEIAYSRAKRMLCVVNGTPENECKVDDMPKVVHATFPEDVEAAQCTEDGKASGSAGEKYVTVL